MSLSIALLIPTFNAATTVAATLASVNAQPHATKVLTQVMLADDGSTDDTVAVALAEWQSELALDVVLREKNIGQFANVNAAVERLSRDADWILILHADDVAKPTWLDEMAARMQMCAPEVASICSSWDNWFPDDSIVPGENSISENVRVISGTPASVRHTLRKGCWWHISGCAIRSSAFAQIGLFRTDLAQMADWEWQLRCLERGGGIEYIPRALIQYRQHAQSTSAASFRTNRDIRESLDVLQKYGHYLARAEQRAFLQQRAGWVIRRMGRALVRGQFERTRENFATLRLIWSQQRAITP